MKDWIMQEYKTVDHTSFNPISPPMVQVRTTDFEKENTCRCSSINQYERDKYFLGQENRRIWNLELRRFGFF
jgi:hypothetical protein